MTTITIQLAEISEVTLLHTILVENNYKYHKARFMQEVFKNRVYSILTTNYQLLDTVIGTITLFPTKPDEYPFGVWNDHANAWYICRLATKQNLQSTYTEIFHQLEILARAECIAVLRVALPIDTSLQSLYESFGFTIVATNPHLLFMEKKLDTVNTTNNH